MKLYQGQVEKNILSDDTDGREAAHTCSRRRLANPAKNQTSGPRIALMDADMTDSALSASIRAISGLVSLVAARGRVKTEAQIVVRQFPEDKHALCEPDECALDPRRLAW